MTINSAKPSDADVERADRDPLERVYSRIEIEAEADYGDDEEAAYRGGIRDGFSEAIQLLDTLTGGDGEYRFCTDSDPERHCPTPVEMGNRIVARLSTPQPTEDSDTPLVEEVREVLSRTHIDFLGELLGMNASRNDLERLAQAAITIIRRSVLAEVAGWQPIETAPKDRLILLAAEFAGPGDWRIKVGGWHDQQYWQVFGASWKPTHWMPLPPPPAIQSGEINQ